MTHVDVDTRAPGAEEHPPSAEPAGEHHPHGFLGLDHPDILRPWKIERLALGLVRWVFLPLSILVVATTTLAPTLGFRTMAVTTGSMRPTIDPTDAVIVRTKNNPPIRLHQIIVFRHLHDEGMVTHRVIAIRTVHGQLHYETKGDANNSPDTDLVPASNVYGQVLYRVPRVGKLLYQLTRPVGRLVMLGPPIGAVVAEELLLLLRGARATRARRRRQNAME
jgi:signal peptidase